MIILADDHISNKRKRENYTGGARGGVNDQEVEGASGQSASRYPEKFTTATACISD